MKRPSWLPWKTRRPCTTNRNRGVFRPAREAISLYYRDHGTTVDPDQIFLTTSTSEAYSFLFRLLCDPGDEVLIGQPGYPLFDFLARLDDVRLVAYELFYDHGWHLDLESLRRRITPRTRAITLVHPNNPTGHFTAPAERAAIEELCREHGLALIVDEVFLDYAHPGCEGVKSFATGSHAVPTFVLSGLSKVAALPQMKAAWIACFAEPEALQRLEIISDTFLSMSAPDSRRTSRLAESAGGNPGTNQAARASEPGNVGCDSAPPNRGEPAGGRSGMVRRTAGSRVAAGRTDCARSLAAAWSGGPRWWTFWLFRSRMAGGEPACERGGVPRGDGGACKHFKTISKADLCK